MKGNEALQRSYNKQKELFTTAQRTRIQNRNVQIQQIQEKIKTLTALQQELVLQNQREREFESFDSFRLKAEEQHQQKKQERLI
jgi:hypothetical protein